MAATATTWECGGVPAFARGSPGITLHDLPAPRPQGLLQSAAPIERALAVVFLIKLKLKLFKKNV